MTFHCVKCQPGLLLKFVWSISHSCCHHGCGTRLSWVLNSRFKTMLSTFVFNHCFNEVSFNTRSHLIETTIEQTLDLGIHFCISAKALSRLAQYMYIFSFRSVMPTRVLRCEFSLILWSCLKLQGSMSMVLIYFLCDRSPTSWRQQSYRIFAVVSIRPPARCHAELTSNSSSLAWLNCWKSLWYPKRKIG